MNKKAYLYGDGTEVPDIPKEIVDTRIVLLNKQLQRELAVPYMERNTDRIAKIHKAIHFWEALNDN